MKRGDQLGREGPGVGARGGEVDGDGDGGNRQRAGGDAAPQRQRVPPAGLRLPGEQALLEARPDAGRGGGLREFGIEAREPAAPEAQVGAERRLVPEPGAQRLALGLRQEPEHIFGHEDAVLAGSGNVAVVAHAERHSLSLIRLRLSQVRMVLSGTLWRSANSS